MSAALTADQDRALRHMRANLGETSEGSLFYEGLNRPRHTLRSLERRGLVRRVEYLGEENGYLYELVAA